MKTEIERPTWRARIEDQLARVDGTLDAAELAEKLASDLSDEERHMLIIGGLKSRISSYLGELRGPATQQAARGESARWANVREQHDRLADYWLGFRDRPSKRLIDATVADLNDAAEWFEDRIAGFTARRDAYHKIARRLRREGATTVAELDRRWVEGVLDA